MAPPVIDEIGHRYGKLLVLSRARNGNHRGAYWLCQCDCGEQMVAYGVYLRGGDVRSCGCLFRELVDKRTLSKGQAAFNAVLANYKQKAKERGLSWDLAEEKFRDLVAQSCHYCGTGLSLTFGRCDYNGDFTYNGLDRLDNDLGYNVENVVPSCSKCNYMKGGMNYDEFIARIRKVYLRLDIQEVAL